MRWCGAVEVRDDEWTGRRAGIVELSLLNTSGWRSCSWEQHGVAGEHSPPFRVVLGEGDDRLPIVVAAGDRGYAIAAVWRRIANPLSCRWSH